MQSFEGIRCTDASRFPVPAHHKASELASFGFKVFAMYISTFRRALYLDSDNMPFILPEKLLADESFQRTGNLFWRDYYQREGWFVVQAEGKLHDEERAYRFACLHLELCMRRSLKLCRMSCSV